MLWGITALELSTSGSEANAAGGAAECRYDDGGYDGSTNGLPAGCAVLKASMDVVSFAPGVDGWLSLRFFYTDEELADAGVTDESRLRLYWDSNGTWTCDGTGSYFAGAPAGGSGDHGVNLGANYAWCNVTHASEWILVEVPEPATLVVLALGGMALLTQSRRG